MTCASSWSGGAEKEEEFPLAPMGVLAPVSAHAGHSAQPPIGTGGNFPARVSAKSISANFPIFWSGIQILGQKCPDN